MERITQEKYLEALKIVKAYEKQLRDDKLVIYEGCTKENLLITEGKDFRNNPAWYFWVTKEKELPDRNCDGIVTYDLRAEFYFLEGSSIPYKTYEAAKNNLIATFKRKGYIK